jgi:dCMP deaminase
MRERDLYFMNIAQSVASGSKDPRRKVGAIIVKNDIIISTGFNGLARGFSKDYIENYWKSPLKDEYVIHAEVNCIINAARSNGNTVGSTMYCTFFPCHKCASQIINAGIVRIVSPLINRDKDVKWLHSIDTSQELFTDCGVEMVFRAK